MSINLQKWLWRMTLLVLFALSLFYVLAMLNGFRFDFYTNEIRRTGIVSLSYNDPQAEVFLDGRRLPGRLPFAATGLLPGHYQLMVSREGYGEYHLPVEVFTDRITRVGSVFLVPEDPASKVEQLLSVGAVGDSIFWEGGYFFWLEGQTLHWVRLAAPSGQPLELILPFERISKIEVVSSTEAVIYGAVPGQRAILGLTDVSLRPIAYSSNFQYVGNRWLYQKDDLLVLFNREINQLVWAKQPRPGSEILSAKMLVERGRVFLSVRFAEAGRDAFYEVVSSGDFILLSEKEVDWVGVDPSGNVDYLVEGRELWRYLTAEKKSILRYRFAGPISFYGTNLSFRGSEGLLLFRDDHYVWLADETLRNMVRLFEVPRAPSLYLLGNSTLIWLQIDQSANHNSVTVNQWKLWE